MIAQVASAEDGTLLVQVLTPLDGVATVATCPEAGMAQFIADLLTVATAPSLWGFGPGMGFGPAQPMVWLTSHGQPIPFEGPTLEVALHVAAQHLRGER